MAFYRSYRLDKDGHIVERHDFDATDDTAALALAGERFAGSRYELWELGRRVLLPASA